MVALSPRPVYTIGTVGKRNYETVKEETKMVIQALGIILVLAVVMSAANQFPITPRASGALGVSLFYFDAVCVV